MGAPVINGEQAANPDVYVPFPVALEWGILGADEVSGLTPQTALDKIRAGIMPPEGGVVTVGGDNIAAFDLQVCETKGERLHILPTSKLAVDDETDRMLLPGELLFSTDDGLIKVIGRAVEKSRTEWLSRHRVYKKLAGKVACQLYGLESKDYEVHDVTNAGVLVAKPRVRVF